MQEQVVGKDINSKINAVQREVKAIKKTKGKDNRAPYAYRGIEDIYNSLGKLLASHGIVVCPLVVEKRGEVVGSKGANPTVLYDVTMRYVFKSIDDASEVVAEGVGQGIDNGNKAPAIAQSMAEKAVLTSVFKIPTQDVADSESANRPLPPAQFRNDEEQFLSNVTNGRQRLNGTPRPAQANGARQNGQQAQQAKPPKLTGMQELMARSKRQGWCLDENGNAVPQHILNALKKQGHNGVVTDANLDECWALIKTHYGVIDDDPADANAALFDQEAELFAANNYPAN